MAIERIVDDTGKDQNELIIPVTMEEARKLAKKDEFVRNFNYKAAPVLYVTLAGYLVPCVYHFCTHDEMHQKALSALTAVLPVAAIAIVFYLTRKLLDSTANDIYNHRNGTTRVVDPILKTVVERRKAYPHEYAKFYQSAE